MRPPLPHLPRLPGRGPRRRVRDPRDAQRHRGLDRTRPAQPSHPGLAGQLTRGHRQGPAPGSLIVTRREAGRLRGQYRWRTGETKPAPASEAAGAAAGCRDRDNDERQVEEAVLQLAGTRKNFAPLALATGAFVMLFSGLRLLVTNWRLMLVQALPAMWIWAATYDLKAKVLRGQPFHDIRGRGDAERPLPPVRLRDVRPPTRARPVAPLLPPLVQVPEVSNQVLPVGPPRSPRPRPARPSGSSPGRPSPAAPG
jgi:hypothetical protein